MTRDEFLGRLGELLACLPADQVRETQEFYAEAIADRMEDGMGEEEAVAAMGAPGEVAEAVLDDLPAVPRAIARTRRRSTTLLWVLTIVWSPVWVPLLLAFAAVAVAVYVCIWILALCVWIVAAALGGAGVVELVFAACGVVIGHVPYVLASAGVGLGCIGAALLAGAGAWAASKQIARLSALWVKKAVSPFWKDRGEKGGTAAHLAAKKGVSTMTSAKKIYLAVAGGLVAAGVVLAGTGFIASGLDPAVFTTQIDMRDDTIVLGGVEVDDPTGLPLIEQLDGFGEVDTSGITASESPAAPEAPAAP